MNGGHCPPFLLENPTVRICRVLIFALLLLGRGAMAVEVGPDLLPADSSQIDRVLEAAVDSGLITGAVVLIGDGSRDLFLRPYGVLSPEPGSSKIQVDTIFDLASLTKVLATAPSVMKLVEEGRLGLHDPLTRWFPEFVGRGKDGIEVYHLLTHTSGLVDFPLRECGTVAEVFEKAALLPVRGEPGERFKYADINFILLGELVGRVSGKQLDMFARDSFFAPLGMTSTLFNPAGELQTKCAATRIEADNFLNGTVQDPNARALGGVAGHAGLFGTAADLSRFCRMVLAGGKSAGKRVLAEETVRKMTSPNFFQDGTVVRGLGWDLVSPYSSPRGSRFPCTSFGHTGYSGCSIWIDPESGLFVCILASRRDYQRTGEFRRLRGTVSDVAVAAFAKPTQRKCRENRENDSR